MKKSLLMLGLIVAMGQSVPAIAGEDDHDHHHGHERHDEERIDHYAAEKPTSKETAIALLNKKLGLVEDVLEKETLHHNDLESIHQASYSLEAAVDYLKAHALADSELLETIDDAAQKVHYASEDHEEADLRKAFKTLKFKSNKLQ